MAMTKIDRLIADTLGPRDEITLRGECRILKAEKHLTGVQLLEEGEVSCDKGIARPSKKEHMWNARFERARVVRRHETTIEVEVFSVEARRDIEEETLLRTVLVAL